MDTANHKVVVIGAGIIGLQTAMTLLKAGFEVTIVSKFWPGDKNIEYTSPWAGAWRANVDPSDVSQQKWDKETLTYWQEEVKHYTSNESGLEMNRAVLYWDFSNPESEDPEHQIWYANFIPGFRKLPASSLPSGSIAGISYQTYCLSPTRFLQHRLRQCKELGVKTETAELQSLEDVFKIESCSSASGIVNCAGLGARALVTDEKVFPTKGQTIVVKGKAEKISIRVGGKWDVYSIPQPGSNTTVLAGCKLPNDWTTNVDDNINQWILDQCKPLAPELLNENGQFDVIAFQVGHRPSRRGGPRVEVEWLDIDKDSTKFVCHNYGHGGSGYEDSVGTANEAMKLIVQVLNKDT